MQQSGWKVPMQCLYFSLPPPSRGDSLCLGSFTITLLGEGNQLPEITNARTKFAPKFPVWFVRDSKEAVSRILFHC